MEETTLQEILESTVAVARGLEALHSEHEALLTDYYTSENIDSSEGTVPPCGTYGPTYLLRSLRKTAVYSSIVVAAAHNF